MNNECLICFEDCDENVSCCEKNIHLKCINSYWQHNPNNYGICPHCTLTMINGDIESGNTQSINTQSINSINVQNINNSINNNKLILKYMCCILSILTFFLILSTY